MHIATQLLQARSHSSQQRMTQHLTFLLFLSTGLSIQLDSIEFNSVNFNGITTTSDNTAHMMMYYTNEINNE